MAGRDATTTYMTVVGMRAPVLEQLLTRFEHAPARRGHVYASTTYRTTTKSDIRSVTALVENGRLTITHDPDILKRSPFPLVGDQRLISVLLEGPDPTRTWTSLPAALGVDTDDLIPFEDLAHNFSPGPQVLAAMFTTHIGEVAASFVAATRWADLPFRPPLYLVVPTSREETAVARDLLNSCAPAFIRPWLPTAVVPPSARELLTSILTRREVEMTAEMNGADPAGPLVVPHTAVLLAEAPDATDARVMAYGRTSLKGPRRRHDARKLRAALTELMNRAPDLSDLMPSLRPPAPVETAPESERDELSEQVAALTRELEQARESVRTRDQTIATLRRELRAAHHAHDSLARATSADSPATSTMTPDMTANPTVVSGPDPAPATPAGRGQTAFAAHEPATFADLFDLARDLLPSVVLPEKVADQVELLVGATKTARWVARTWAILTTMQDYADARASGDPSPNLRSWMAAQAHPAFPPTQVATGESAMTTSNRRFASARTFPVPTDVDPSGWAPMHAHVRVDSGGKPPAPRLHYLDDTGGVTGLIHVGYIGPHLTNFLTS